MTIIVNFFAGSGAGKSSLAWDVSAELKWLGEINVEYVPEWCKAMVWEERKEPFKDQNIIFGEQHYNIKRLLDKLDVVVTDSPVLLSAFYNQPEDKIFNQHVLNQFNKFNNYNYFVNRVKAFQPDGRFQTEEEAKQDDIKLRKMLDNFNIKYQFIKGEKASTDIIANQIKNIVNAIKQAKAWKC